MEDTTTVYIGRNAGAKTVFPSTNRNTVVGSNAGAENLSGVDNVFVGEQAGFRNSTGESNSFVGGIALTEENIPAKSPLTSVTC